MTSENSGHCCLFWYAMAKPPMLKLSTTCPDLLRASRNALASLRSSIWLNAHKSIPTVRSATCTPCVPIVSKKRRLSASIKPLCCQCKRLKAQDIVASPWGTMSAVHWTVAAARFSNNAWCACRMVAKAHTVFTRWRGSNSGSRLFDTDVSAMVSSSTSSLSESTAKAQAMLAWSCGLNSATRRRLTHDTILMSGRSRYSKTANAQTILAISCGLARSSLS
mmetsp:Transcript_3012/g.6686  ORF Transcript_3012/g.6686 Transcript_3012/m.6686 type:complete len:221 (+) Transcript_3012:1259-1921(+)